ncbi:MAG: tryptophan--tRNA ligase [Candidatus Omnitrophota bacterium]
MPFKRRVLSGMRPTGELHLGHWVGALENWKALQEKYECFFMVADWHALMSDYESPGSLEAFVRGNVADWIACGINPERSVIFRQSDVPEHLELHMVLSVITPLGWVERVPTYKEQLREVQGRNLATYGFLGYPVLQAADILLYRAEMVPVGEDQVAHLELAREIVRRFRSLYQDAPFPEPKELLTRNPKLLGIDGRKMSKSYQNTIALSDSPETIRAMAQKMFTDPLRIKMTDPGHPETCNVYQYYKLFARHDASRVKENCQNARVGCVEDKAALAEALIEATEEIRKKRTSLLKEQGWIDAILKEGKEKAKHVASETMKEVRRLVGLGTPRGEKKVRT